LLGVRFNVFDGCNHFKQIDDSLCDKVRPIVVFLIMSNNTLPKENQQLQTTKEERACDKKAMKRVKEMNSR